jgi:hypothetical protein
MGSLTPGATYIYESPDHGKTVYAREMGSTEKKLVGYQLPQRRDPMQYDIIETQLWQDIVEAGKTNPSLQKTLDRAMLIYQTIKDDVESKKGS